MKQLLGDNPVLTCVTGLSAIACIALGISILSPFAVLPSGIAEMVRDQSTNEGLCFLLAGGGLLMTLVGRPRTAIAFAGIVLAISSLTFIEYLTGADLYVDRLFGSSSPRMLQSAAISFMVAAFALFLINRRSEWRYQRSIGGLLGFIVLSLGAALLFGYSIGIQTSDRWGYVGPLSAVSASGLMCLGLGVIAMTWVSERAQAIGLPELQELVVVYAVGGMCIVSMLSFVFGVLPLHDKLRRLSDQAVLLALEGRAAVAEEYVKRLKTIGARLSGPSAASQTGRGADYRRNLPTLQPPEFIGVCRSRRESPSECLFAAGEEIPPALRLVPLEESPTVRVFGPFLRESRSYLIIASPLADGGGSIGARDLFLVSGSGLLTLLRDTTLFDENTQILLREHSGEGSAPLYRLDMVTGEFATVEQGGEILPAPRDRRGFLPTDPRGHLLVAHTPVGGTPWSLLAKVDPRLLEADLRVDLITASTAVFVLVTFGAFGTFLLIRRLLLLAQGLEGALQTHSRQLEEELVLRREAERSLEEQRSFLRQVIDINPNFVFAKDREGRFTLINKAVADAYGTTVEELLGKTDADFNPNRDEVEHFRRDDLRVMDQGIELLIPEEVITDARGDRRWLQTMKRPILNSDGSCEQVLGVATDVTQRKLAEEKLGELAAIVASSEDGIISTALDGTVVSWNKGAERIYGYSAEEIIGKAVNTYVPDERREELRSILERIIQGDAVTALETRRKRIDGSEFDASVTVSPIRDAAGKVVGASAITRDITVRKRTEIELANYRGHLEELVDNRTQALLQAQDQMRRTERLASMGALAAGIAHEINNPLGAIILAAENTLEEQATGDDLAQLLRRTCERILKHARRCGQIVKGVLQFSRQERTEKWPGDINLIVKSSLQLARELLSIPESQVGLDLSPSLPPVLINPIEIEQVLINLLRNSVDAGGAGVHITISTAFDGDRVSLIQKDDGPGMSEDVQKHMFDLFFTTRQQEGGTGLGLSIVHGIISAHGGTIEVTSAIGKGTEVRISLPPARVLESGAAAE